MTLGDRIRKVRIERRMSLEKLGRALGVTRQLVWQWENNESDPRKHIAELCRILEVPYEELYGKPSPKAPLLAKIDQLEPAQRAAVEAMVDSFLVQGTQRPKRSRA